MRPIPQGAGSGGRPPLRPDGEALRLFLDKAGLSQWLHAAGLRRVLSGHDLRGKQGSNGTRTAEHGSDPFCLVHCSSTSIWGPWFGVPYRGFFLSIARGRYCHLGSVDPPRSFGYVGNVVEQILKLLEADAARIHKRVFYFSDYEQYSIRIWADTIGKHLGKPAIRTLPEPLVWTAARAGDLESGWLKNPPLTTFRLRNMRTDTSGVPMDETRAVVGMCRLPWNRALTKRLAGCVNRT